MPEPVWVILDGPHIHIAPTLIGVLWEFLTERGQDRHLIG